MEKQIVPQGDNGCSPTREISDKSPGTALVTVDIALSAPPVCAALRARIDRAARKCNHPAPVVLPAAIVTLVPVDLPLKSARLRRKALPFALEDHLATAMETTALCVGPGLGNARYLCAACDLDDLRTRIPPEGAPGVALPDILGVPKPVSDKPGWNVWRSGQIVYVRSSDGGGFTCRADALPVLWRAAGRPDVTSLTGPLPQGPAARDLSGDPPEMAPDDFGLDLRPQQMRARHHRWHALARFAAIIVLVAGLGHLALLAWDVRVIQRLAQTRLNDVAVQLADFAPGLSPELPLRVIADRLFPKTNINEQDPFMNLLADVSRAFAGQSEKIAFREMRYGARDGVLTLLVQGSGLDSLQAAEAALGNAGLRVTSGAATVTDGRAEMFMQITGASR